MTAGPRRRSRRAFTLRVKPVSNGANSKTSSICAPWTAKSKITAISQAPATRVRARQKLPNGQELQVIEFISGEANAACDRRIERIPDDIMQFHGKPRRPCIARRWHLDVLT